MTREAAWRFLDMGRRLERALNTALVARAGAGRRARADEAPVLEALLDTADSAMTYRRRYRATLQVAPVVDLLAADEGNPRSILFQLARAGRARRGAAARPDARAAQRGGADRVRGAVRVPPGRRRRRRAPREGGARPGAAPSCAAAWSPTCSACPTRCRGATSRPRPCRARSPRRRRADRAPPSPQVSHELRVRHVTEYMYSDGGVDLAPRAAPAAARRRPGQMVSARALTVTPEPAVRRERVDWFGNRVDPPRDPRAAHAPRGARRRFIVDIAREPPPEDDGAWEPARDWVRAARGRRGARGDRDGAAVAARRAVGGGARVRARRRSRRGGRWPRRRAS